jgi:hypothetical protein
MPALLKGVLVPVVPNAILDVLLSIIFGAVFRLVFGVPPFEDLPVYRCFLYLGQRLGPVFRPVLAQGFARVFRHFQTRTCSLPYKNCLDVCLTIRHKSSHPALVPRVGK